MNFVRVGLIKVKGQSNQYFIVLEKVSNDENEIEIAIRVQEDVSGGKSWNGRCDSRSISKWASEINLSLEQYTEETIAALTGQMVNKKQYIVEMKLAEHEERKLSWKRVEEEILFTLGSVQLIQTQTNNNLLKVCVNSMKSLQEELEDTKRVKQALETENDGLKNRLDECSLSKQQHESQLYTNFLLLLNEKKRRIKELEMLKDKTVEKNEQPAKNAKKPKMAKVHENSYMLDSSEDDSEQMEPFRTQPVKLDKRSLAPNKRPVATKEQKPSVSHAKVDEDETLVMDSEETLIMNSEDLLANF